MLRGNFLPRQCGFLWLHSCPRFVSYAVVAVFRFLVPYERRRVREILIAELAVPVPNPKVRLVVDVDVVLLERRLVATWIGAFMLSVEVDRQRQRMETRRLGNTRAAKRTTSPSPSH